MNKEVLIIGGGIAGLSAGIYARINGFNCTIIEKNKTAGGECTGWDRRGYHIDGCIHWLVGTKEGTGINQLWKQVGALEGVEIYHPETFLSFEYQGTELPFYRDLDRLEHAWTALSPEDTPAIREFTGTVRTLQSFDIPAEKPMDLMGPIEKIKLLLSMKDAGMVMKRYGKIGLTEFARNFTHPVIRSALASFLPEGYSASSLFFALAAFSKGQASIPMGGSRAFAQRMVDRYLNLGGVLHTGCEVTELERSGRQITGVVTDRGDRMTADYVIAACDAHLLFDRLLKGSVSDKAFQKRFADPEGYPLASQITIALGYSGSAEQMHRTTSIETEDMQVGTRSIDRLTVTHYQYEQDFAPPGCVVFTIAINQFHDDYEYWQQLGGNRNAYREEKQRIGQEVLSAMVRRYPEMEGKLELLDVVTPLTFEHWCNAYRGAFMAFLPTVGAKPMEHTGRIKGLDNLLLSGQWLQPPGGLPVALLTGRDSIMRICRKEKQRFQSDI